MIDLRFTLSNPFARYYKIPWKPFYQRAFSLSKNKTLEIEICKSAYELIEFELGTSFRGHDHAGPKVAFNLFGLDIRIQMIDNRHWDYETNRWST